MKSSRSQPEFKTKQHMMIKVGDVSMAPSQVVSQLVTSTQLDQNRVSLGDKHTNPSQSILVTA